MAKRIAAGWSFRASRPRGYRDFAYFPFVIGMTFQVSDVQITSGDFRQLVLVHSLLSFAFNTVILALDQYCLLPHLAGQHWHNRCLERKSRVMTFLKKILLVDYEARANALVRTALEETGKYLVKEERDSRNAVNAARWFQPDLVLFDMSLTKRQAQAAARELQEDPAFHQTPVVFLSVNTSADGGVASGGILSGYSFMANPVRTEELVRYVADLIGMRSDLADAVRQIPTK